MLVKEQPKLVSPQPKSFAALMELYESNYFLIRLLCGDMRRLPPRQISNIPNGIPLVLNVMETSRHTTTLMLTYQFNNPGAEHETRPDLLIKVYHDARQAEVTRHRCRWTDTATQRPGHETDNMLLCRWRMNRFLHKWINYLRRQGHTFS